MVQAGLDLHGELPDAFGRPGRSMLVFARLFALVELGRLAEADDAVRSADDRGESEPAQFWRRLSTARLALLAGQPRRMIEAVEVVARRAATLHQAITERWALALSARARLQLGDVEQAALELARVAELEDGNRGAFHQDLDRAHAWLAYERRGADEAVAKLFDSAEEARRLGRLALEVAVLHDICRMGEPSLVADRLMELSTVVQGPLMRARAKHVRALVDRDSAGLDEAAAEFAGLGAAALGAELRGEVPVGRV